jgi:SAM-dependent methyltransferase
MSPRQLAICVPAPVRRALRRLLRYNPRNHWRRDAACIDQDVDDALRAANETTDAIAGLGFGLDGLRYLELGPGHNFGPQLLLASRGVQVTVADRFLVGWDPGYHPAFYRALRERWPGPAAALDRVIGAGAHHAGLTLLAEPAERLSGIAEAGIDVVLSNAVLEHVFDLPAACRELARITRIGGANIHQIDFRWHRLGFTRPLDFLLHSDARFRRDFAADHGESGNRWRPAEMAALFRRAGFAVRAIDPTEQASADLLAGFLPRLRRARSAYSTWPEADLSILGARFDLLRVDDPAERCRGAAEVEAQQRWKTGAPAAQPA